jgi:chemotaxis signal transduction protein
MFSLHRIFGKGEGTGFQNLHPVIHRGGKEIGIVVDAVDKVMFLPQQNISSPPLVPESMDDRSVSSSRNDHRSSKYGVNAWGPKMMTL